MNCKEQILTSVQAITQQTGKDAFFISDLIDYMQAKGLACNAGTIRNQINYWMGKHSQVNKSTGSGVFERVGHGQYRYTGAASAMAKGPLETKRAIPPIQPQPKEITLTQGAETKHGREYLINFGFKLAGHWYLDEGKINYDLSNLPNSDHGLYAFVLGDQVLYLGKTSNSLKRRLNSYRRPGPSQPTNIRANAMLTGLLKTHPKVEIYAWVDPSSGKDDELFLDKAAGYETALIRKLQPPWNKMK